MSAVDRSRSRKCRTATLFRTGLLARTERVSGLLGAPNEAARSVTPDPIMAEIDRISGLPLAAVQVLWRTYFGKSAPAVSRELLVRMLAWRIQEEAFGGHDAATLRLLDAYRRQDVDKVVLFRRLKPGTSVVREYQGVRHIVTISENGFIWQCRTYDSLSAIARKITGSRWNGPRFFGLRTGERAAPARRVF